MNPKRMLARLIAAAFIGIMLAGPGAAVFPSTLRWGAWAACPEGTSAAPERFRASYSRPGESQVRLLCAGPDGQAEDHTGMAIVGLWAMYTVGLAVLFSLLGLRAGTRSGTTATVPAVRAAVPPEAETKARALLEHGQKIHAIKVVRDATGMGLKEAKEWVEALAHRQPASSAPAALTPSQESRTREERLVELERLFDANLITADEYEAKKAEILAEL
ncbi:MAG: ribosomal protein L7/L12 [Longimicrobiaceae bacterium]